jgi:hypothetical protein
LKLGDRAQLAIVLAAEHSRNANWSALAQRACMCCAVLYDKPNSNRTQRCQKCLQTHCGGSSLDLFLRRFRPSQSSWAMPLFPICTGTPYILYYTGQTYRQHCHPAQKHVWSCRSSPDLLEALQVLAQLLRNVLRERLPRLARLPVALPVEEPVGHLELPRVLDDGHQLLNLVRRQQTRAAVRRVRAHGMSGCRGGSERHGNGTGWQGALCADGRRWWRWRGGVWPRQQLDCRRAVAMHVTGSSARGHCCCRYRQRQRFSPPSAACLQSATAVACADPAQCSGLSPSLFLPPPRAPCHTTAAPPCATAPGAAAASATGCSERFRRRSAAAHSRRAYRVHLHNKRWPPNSKWACAHCSAAPCAQQWFITRASHRLLWSTSAFLQMRLENRRPTPGTLVSAYMTLMRPSMLVLRILWRARAHAHVCKHLVSSVNQQQRQQL